MTIRRMQNELAQWGEWARATERNCGLKPYVSPAYTLLKSKMQQATYHGGCEVVLDDDALLAIDNLVGMIKLSRPDLWQWIDYHYLKGYPVQALAAMTKTARYRIDGYLLAAESWMDSRLEVECEKYLKIVG